MRDWRATATAAMGVAVILAATLCGCEGTASTAPSPAAGVTLFGPTAMRLHPIFTQAVDLNHVGNPDAIEAQLEFDDQFGDPTKASGQALFELFSLRKDQPDPRGERVAGPWVGSLQTLAEQYARWNTTLRTYKFELKYPGYRTDQSYVLTASFEKTGGGRFFDRLVLAAVPEKPRDRHHSSRGLLDPGESTTAPAGAEAKHERSRTAATRPATGPSTRGLEFETPDPSVRP